MRRSGRRGRIRAHEPHQTLRRIQGRAARHDDPHPPGRRRGRVGRPAQQAGRLDRDHHRLGPGRGARGLHLRTYQRRPPEPCGDARPGVARGVPLVAGDPLLRRPVPRGFPGCDPGLRALHRIVPGV